MTHPTRPGTDSGSNYTPGAAAPPPAAQEKPSLVEDFIEIFYAPSRVFARREGSSFWAPLLVITVIAALFAFANRSVYGAIFDAEFSRTAAKVMAENPQVTAEMMESQRGIGEGIGTIFSYIGTPILIFLVGVFTWLAAKIVSAKVSMQAAILIVAFAQIPRLVMALLWTVQALVLDTGTITSQHSFGFSPARFMDPDSVQKPIIDFVGRFDVFTIWATILIGIGVAVIAKVPRGKGYAAAAIVWAIASVLTLLPALWS